MGRSLLSTPRSILIYSIFWWIIIQSHFMVLNWYGFPLRVALFDSLVNNILLQSACWVIMNILRFYSPKGRGYVYLLAWCIFFTVVVAFAGKGILFLLLREYPEYLASYNLSLILRISFIFLILCCFTLVTVIWYSWNEQQEQEKRKQDAEKLAREAELFKLRQQLQPHFLFNSLNSINALIGGKPQEARRMVQQLSDFLRGTIKREEHEKIRLSEEMQYLQLYLEIEKVRFGNRLSVHVEVGETANECMIPALLLQPVVENAIKFGLYDTTGDITIEIQALREQDNLLIRITNPFDPQTSLPQKGTGFGLSSVQRRLDLLFAKPGLLQTETKDHLFITTIKVPQHE